MVVRRLVSRRRNNILTNRCARRYNRPWNSPYIVKGMRMCDDQIRVQEPEVYGVGRMMNLKSKIHRSRIDIVTSILMSTMEPTSTTHVMYMGFLSSELTRGYLADLIEQGLLSYNVGNKTFEITEEGKKYLRRHTMLRIGRQLHRL